MGIELTGVDEFVKAMQEKAKKLESKSEKSRILKAGAEPIRKAIAARAPRDPASSVHMADNIVISDIKDGDFVEVGPEKSFFYAKYQEFGTSRGQPARPFVEPAYLEKKKEALVAMAQETKKVIEGV